MSGELNYPYWQYATITLNYQVNRIELTLTRILFFITFVQYNSQFDNINSSQQWCFRPVSDLSIVHTENNFPQGLEPKKRALVFKDTYWLNVWKPSIFLMASIENCSRASSG